MARPKKPQAPMVIRRLTPNTFGHLIEVDEDDGKGNRVSYVRHVTAFQGYRPPVPGLVNWTCGYWLCISMPVGPPKFTWVQHNLIDRLHSDFKQGVEIIDPTTVPGLLEAVGKS